MDSTGGSPVRKTGAGLLKSQLGTPAPYPAQPQPGPHSEGLGDLFSPQETGWGGGLSEALTPATHTTLWTTLASFLSTPLQNISPQAPKTTSSSRFFSFLFLN